MTLHVYMPRGGGGAFEVELRRRLGRGIHLHVGEERPVDGDGQARYDVLVEGRPRGEDLDASPGLRLVVIPWAGVPPQTREALQARPRLALHNLHHNAAPTAEMAVGLLIAAARRIVPSDQALRRGDWSRRYEEDHRGLLLDGARALIVGYGAIGRRVGRALRGLSMEVEGVTRSGRGGSGACVVHPVSALDDLLPAAQAVVVTVPSTEATRNLLDARRLALLPPEAVLVNVSRGDVVDERGLFEALASGRLGAAGLDVWWRYPGSVEERASTHPSRHPFHTLDQVVLSPHRAGHAGPTERLRAEHLADLLDALARGGPTPNAVNLDEGY